VPPALRGIEDLPRRFTVMAPEVDTVKRFIAMHCAS
jgi:hypothetical protein